MKKVLALLGRGVAALGNILRRDIAWGKVAGWGLATAFVAVLLMESASLLALLVFALGGLFIDRMSSRRPLWNGLFYGLWGALFLLILMNLYILGTPERRLMTLEELRSAGVMAGLSLFQALMGAWLSTSFRRLGRPRGEQPGTEEKRGEKAPTSARRKAAREEPAEPHRRERKG
ncbi:MAG: hypothetical protein ACP5OO_09050 [Chloroflexia bacterium]